MFISILGNHCFLFWLLTLTRRMLMFCVLLASQTCVFQVGLKVRSCSYNTDKNLVCGLDPSEKSVGMMTFPIQSIYGKYWKVIKAMFQTIATRSHKTELWLLLFRGIVCALNYVTTGDPTSTNLLGAPEVAVISTKCNWVMVNGCQQSSTLSAYFDQNARTFMDIRGTKDRWNQLKKKRWDLQNTAPCCIEYAQKPTKLLNTESKQTIETKWRALPPWKWALWNSAKPRQWCSMFVNAQKKGRWPMVNDFKDLRIEILLCGKASSVISWGYPPEMRAAICKDSRPNSSSNSPVLKGWKQVQSMEFLQLNFKKKQFPGIPP